MDNEEAEDKVQATLDISLVQLLMQRQEKSMIQREVDGLNDGLVVKTMIISDALHQKY